MNRISGKKYHFIGIGGIGTSGLAKMLMRHGATVSGSDMSDGAMIGELRRLGAQVFVGHRPENISPEVDEVVISAAITASNPELARASELGVKIRKYAEMLGILFDQFDGIAVAGTHGKSTTSAWLSFVLREAGKKPNFIVGADIPQLGGSSGVGNGTHFVAEACEYDRSFLNLHSKTAIILNIEQDHLDYYRDEDEIVAAFGDFASQVKPGGTLVTNGQDKNCARVIRRVTSRTQELKNSGTQESANEGIYPLPAAPDSPLERGRVSHVVTFGTEPGCDYTAGGLEVVEGTYAFDVYLREAKLGRVHISLPGEHNVMNALAVIAAANAAGLGHETIFKHIGDFTGIDRRLMLKAKIDGITILDDYAHHPTEIRASLRAIRQKYNPKRLWCIFQPHQYSRTRFLLDDFAESFKLADLTIVPEIYFVRDTAESKSTVNAEVLVERIGQHQSKALFIHDFAGILEYLKNNVTAGDLVVTMGAGTIWKVADEYIQWFRERH
ncbi:MAG: UDP-N-acetylmuramate--L-alanine ligase [Planctomycetaceae bacterium]|nr:UDP-N-acetylmuramate--L-alanine ligase [Planctomycetaceae bacterium]